jgi:hypothetical protein
LVVCVRDRPVCAEKTEFGVGVGDGNAREESTAGRVGVPVIGVVAPAVADDDELASNRWGVEVMGFGDGGLED